MRVLRIGARWLIRAITLGVALVFLGVIVFAVVSALTPGEEMLGGTRSIWPSRLEWSNFLRPFHESDFARYMGNSLFVGGAVTLLNVLTCTWAGYAFAKYRFAGRDTMFLIVLATLMIPVEVIYVPLFALIHQLGWVNSFAALIVPAATSAFGIFLMRQAAMGLPEELLEAARLDGASEFRVLFRIAMPLMAGPMAVVAIFIFITNWDSHLWPLLVATDAEHMTLPVGLANMQAGSIGNANLPMIMAAAVLAVLPTLLIFLILQRKFVEGIAASAGLK